MKATESLRNKQKIKAIKTIHAEFKDILKHEKCRTCSCFYGDVLNTTFEKIKHFGTTRADYGLSEIEKDFENWIKEAGFLKMHG
jgi:hypothetical protein